MWNALYIVAKDRYVTQYISPKQLVYLTPERIVQLYEGFKDNGDLCQLQNEVYRWKTQWDVMNVAERPATLDDTIREINPDLYPKMYTAVVILMAMSVSSASTDAVSQELYEL